MVAHIRYVHILLDHENKNLTAGIGAKILEGSRFCFEDLSQQEATS